MGPSPSARGKKAQVKTDAVKKILVEGNSLSVCVFVCLTIPIHYRRENTRLLFISYHEMCRY